MATAYEENAVIEDVMDESSIFRPHVSWSAIFVGAVIAVATTLFLLLLGSGIGLALVSPSAAGKSVEFLTLGAIYFLAAQAFGLAVGGHITGRLIGPAIETSIEEEFRAGAHGLAVWAVAVVASVVVAAVSAVLVENGPVNVASLYGASRPAHVGALIPQSTGYWVDTLFRAMPEPSPASHASLSLDGVRFAQNDTGVESDVGPSGPPDTAQPPGQPDQAQPDQSQPDQTQTDQGQFESRSGVQPSSPTPRAKHPLDIRVPQNAGSQNGNDSASLLPPVNSPPRNIGADKAEVGRILDFGLEGGGFLSPDDRGRVAQLIAQDANLSFEAATTRVNAVQSQIHNAQSRAADAARTTASYASLWTALALLFGAIVAIVAAISARWEDDVQAMLPFRRASETNYG